MLVLRSQRPRRVTRGSLVILNEALPLTSLLARSAAPAVGVADHGPELDDLERPAVAPGPRLSEEDRGPVIHPDRHGRGD